MGVRGVKRAEHDPAFHRRLAVIGTRHGKEAVIGPVLRGELGVEWELLDALDTDSFGTFTREIPRRTPALETVRAKAAASLALHDRASFAVASEGSFGPHPQLPLVAGGVELVLLLARDTGLEIVGIDVTADTNFASRAVHTLEEAHRFAASLSFPSHGVIVMAAAQEKPAPELSLEKGIVEPHAFDAAVERVLRAHGAAWVEADMRAHMNPTRMRSIERATHDLVRKARSACPRCARPGYVVAERLPGLPCADCGGPTSRARAEVHACAGCGLREETRIAGEASPFHCEHCNP